MKEKRINLGEFRGHLIWAFFEEGKGFTACSSLVGCIGPLKERKKAKEAVCDLLQAENLYRSRCIDAFTEDNGKQVPYFRKYPSFSLSSEHQEVLKKYNLSIQSEG